MRSSLPFPPTVFMAVLGFSISTPDTASRARATFSSVVEAGRGISAGSRACLSRDGRATSGKGTPLGEIGLIGGPSFDFMHLRVEMETGVYGGVGGRAEARFKALVPRLCSGVIMLGLNVFAADNAGTGRLMARGMRDCFTEDGGVATVWKGCRAVKSAGEMNANSSLRRLKTCGIGVSTGVEGSSPELSMEGDCVRLGAVI